MKNERPKSVVHGSEVRAKLLQGVNVLADAVQATLGPKGRNVILDISTTDPVITKDGVSVAKAIYLSDPIENAAVRIVKQVASKACDDAGDGTTTATVLARAIITEAMSAVDNGANPMDIRRGIDMAVESMRKHLEENITKCDDDDTILRVATISANSDKAIAELILEATKAAGEHGIVSVEEGSSLNDDLKVMAGMEFDRGWESIYFANNRQKGTADYTKPNILITSDAIEDINKLLPIIQLSHDSKKPLVIIADSYEDQVMGQLSHMVSSAGVKMVAIRAPEFGNRRKEVIEDLAILTGAQIITDVGAGKPFKEFEPSMFGHAQAVIASKRSTTIVEGSGEPAAVESRVTVLKADLERAENAFEESKLKERIAKLAASVAVIVVGGATEFEMKERRDRIDDALCATQAAIEDGVLPGGGVGLLRAADELLDLKGKNEDQNSGIKAVYSAVKTPMMQIVANAGGDADCVVSNVLLNDDFNHGYDAAEEQYGDMFAMGIIDPARVTLSALKYAASVASLMITTEAIVTDEPRH